MENDNAATEAVQQIDDDDDEVSLDDDDDQGCLFHSHSLALIQVASFLATFFGTFVCDHLVRYFYHDSLTATRKEQLIPFPIDFVLLHVSLARQETQFFPDFSLTE